MAMLRVASYGAVGPSRQPVLAAVVALLIAGCGGGGGDADAGPPPETIENASYFPLATGDRRAYCELYVPDFTCDEYYDECTSFDVYIETVGGPVTRGGRVGRTVNGAWLRSSDKSTTDYWVSNDAAAAWTSRFERLGRQPAWETQMKLPPKVGDSYTTYKIRGLPSGEDIDRDGIEEKIDATQTVGIDSMQTVSTPAGEFQTAWKRDFWDEVYTYSSNGYRESINRDENSYFDEHLGMVRYSSYYFESSLDLYLIAYDVGGQRSAKSVDEVTVQDCIDVLDPDRPASATGASALGRHAAGHKALGPVAQRARLSALRSLREAAH